MAYKKQDYNNLGAFFRSLPEDHPKLAPLLLYVNRPTVSNLFKGVKKLSFLIPSDSMMTELKKDFEKKDFKSLDLKILSLMIPDTLTNSSDWKNVDLSVGRTYVPIKNISHKNIVFENGSKATLSRNFSCNKGAVCFWELEGTHVPLGAINKKKKQLSTTKKTVKGKFENPGSKLEEKEKNLILEDLRKGNFKQLVCDLYASLDDENKTIANCLINGNPAAEFFLLFDSPMITYNSDLYIENTVSNINDYYSEILSAKGDYLCNNFDVKTIEKLKEFLGDSHFYENEYKRFYTEVEANGTFSMPLEDNSEDKTDVKICHPKVGKYLYSIEIFCLYIKMLCEKLENAPKEDHINIINEMIIFNATTNQKSTKNLIFEDTENPIENLDKFKERFERAGLCLFKTKEVQGSKDKKRKPKSRKLHKQKNMLKNLSTEHKEKMKAFINKN